MDKARIRELKDIYDYFGLNYHASKEEIKYVVKMFKKEHHPDVCGSDVEFKIINNYAKEIKVAPLLEIDLRKSPSILVSVYTDKFASMVVRSLRNLKTKVTGTQVKDSYKSFDDSAKRKGLSDRSYYRENIESLESCRKKIKLSVLRALVFHGYATSYNGVFDDDVKKDLVRFCQLNKIKDEDTLKIIDNVKPTFIYYFSLRTAKTKYKLISFVSFLVYFFITQYTISLLLAGISFTFISILAWFLLYLFLMLISALVIMSVIYIFTLGEVNLFTGIEHSYRIYEYKSIFKLFDKSNMGIKESVVPVKNKRGQNIILFIVMVIADFWLLIYLQGLLI